MNLESLEQAFGVAVIDSSNENKNTRDKAIASKFRGTIQAMFACFELPDAISDKFTALWKGEVNTLKAADIKKLHKELREHRKSDIVNYAADKDTELIEQAAALAEVNEAKESNTDAPIRALKREDILKLVPLVTDKSQKALLTVCAGDISFNSFKKKYVN